MYTTPSDIYEATDGGLNVILSYFPDAAECVGNHTKKFKIRTSDKTASASLKKITGNIWVVTDFGGDQKPRNCIEIVRQQENCDFKEAIALIANRFNIIPPEKQSEIFKAEFTSREATEEEVDGTYSYDVKAEITEGELKVLFAEKVIEYYQATHKENYAKKLNEVCQRYNFSSLNSFTQIKDRKAIITGSTDHYPIFIIDGEGFKKIYQPNNIAKQYRFRYTGVRPKDYIFGYKRLQKEYNDINKEESEDPDEPIGVQYLENVIICSGDRDSLNVAALGYNVIWQNSETAKLSFETMLKLKGMCTNIYNLPDIDITGKRMGHELAMFFIELKTIWLPEELKGHKDWRGNACKDLRDYLKFYSKKAFDDLVKTALPYQFWYMERKYNRKGDPVGFTYAFHNTRAYNFLMKNGFWRFKIDTEKDGYMYIQIDKNNVKQIRANDVKGFINEFLEQRRMDEDLRNTFYRSNQLGETSLSNLKEITIDFDDYDKFSQHIFFLNKTWKITQTGIEEYLPADVSKFVWDNELIKHRVTKLDAPFEIKLITNTDGSKTYDIIIHRKDCSFLNYAINASRVHWKKELEDSWTPDQEAERLIYCEEHKFDIAGPRLTAEEIYEQKIHLINKLYSFGYMLHGYKDPSRPWCVYAMDAKPADNGESHGGSGKSIGYKAIRNFKTNVTLDGRNPRLTDNPHIYELVSEHTDMVLIDDANEYLKFDFFFSPLTGDLTVNPKNNKQFIIPFAKVAKFVITSNYTLRQIDPSTERRILYTVFSDYYHYNSNNEYKGNRSPKDDFGKNLFDDFNEDEWNNFFNTMAYCLVDYLKFEKIDPPMNNVTLRNLQTQMGAAFQAWADVYFSENSGKLDELVPRNEAFEDFIGSSGSKLWTTQKFGKSLIAWCRYNKFVLDPIELQNSGGRIIRKVIPKHKDGIPKLNSKKVATDMIYIQTQKEISKGSIEEKITTPEIFEVSTGIIESDKEDLAF